MGNATEGRQELVETVESPVTHEQRTVEDYVQLGLAVNPQVTEAIHRVESLRFRVPQEVALPDPMVNSATHLAPVQTAAGEQSFSLGVSQKFTNTDRRATRAAIAMDEVLAAEEQLHGIQNEVAETIRSLCYQLLYVRKSIEITNEDFESLGQIAEVILSRYEVKQSVTQQDVLNVQVEQSEVENQLSALRRKERALRARLARMVNLSPKSELEILDELKMPTNELDLDSLTAQAISGHPELAAQLALIRRDRRRICLAALESKPDLTVGLNWIATSSQGISPVANGDDAVQLGIGFNLPVNRDRIRAAIGQARSQSRASQSRLENLRNQVIEQVFELIATAESTRDTLGLLQEDIIPKAQRTLDLSIEEYGNGEARYLQLIENWRSVLKYRITELRLISEFNQTMASLVRVTGRTDGIGSFAMAPQRPALEAVESESP